MRKGGAPRRREALPKSRLREERELGLTYRGRRTRAALGILDVCARALGQLLKQECPLYPQLLDLALYPGEAQSGGVVGIFDFVRAVLELDAFSAIGLLHRGRQGRRHGWRGFDLSKLPLGRHNGG